jgi:hypothetical protein
MANVELMDDENELLETMNEQHLLLFYNTLSI